MTELELRAIVRDEFRKLLAEHEAEKRERMAAAVRSLTRQWNAEEIAAFGPRPTLIRKA